MLIADYSKLYEFFNEVENKIDYLNNLVLGFGTDIPNFSKRYWYETDIPYIQEIDRIEKGIDNLGKYYYYPSSFIASKVWIETGTELKPFGEEDINRWINNLNLLEQVIDGNSTIWNSQLSKINWNESSKEEWM